MCGVLQVGRWLERLPGIFFPSMHVCEEGVVHLRWGQYDHGIYSVRPPLKRTRGLCRVIGASRDLLEKVLRVRVTQLPNVHICSSSPVTGLCCSPDKSAITGADCCAVYPSRKGIPGTAMLHSVEFFGCVSGVTKQDNIVNLQYTEELQALQPFSGRLPSISVQGLGDREVREDAILSGGWCSDDIMFVGSATPSLKVWDLFLLIVALYKHLQSAASLYSVGGPRKCGAASLFLFSDFGKGEAQECS